MFWLKWVFILLIYSFFFIFDMLFAFGALLFPCLISAVSAFVVVFYSSRRFFRRRLIKEKTVLPGFRGLEQQKIAVLFVVKNEGEAFIENLKQYLLFPENVVFFVYDDHSTDGSVEALTALQQQYPDRVQIRSLPVSEKRIHPKGIALEHAFHNVDCSFFFVGDADTKISFDTFHRSLVYMNTRQLELLHLTRRNVEKESISYSIADADEIFVSALQTLHLVPFNFTGSSFFISSTIAKKISFSDQVYSEDSELGRQAKKLARRKDFSVSLHTLERAPSTLFLLMKQRWNWTKYAVSHQFENEFSVVLLAVLISANLMFGLFNIYSLNFLFILFSLFPLLAFSLSTNLTIGAKKTPEALSSSFAYIFLTLLQFGIIFFVQILFLPSHMIRGIHYQKTE